MKFFILIALLIAFLNAAPAREAHHTFMQSDSTSFIAKQKGDEYLHWIETEKGDVLIYNKKSGNYDYAVIQNGILLPSNEIYNKNSRKIRTIQEDVLKLWNKKRAQHH